MIKLKLSSWKVAKPHEGQLPTNGMDEKQKTKLKLNLDKPFPPAVSKRTLEPTGSATIPNKKQKIGPSIQEWEQTEATLKSVNGSFSELKANFQASKAGAAEEFHEQLAARDKEIESLKA